MAQMFQQSPAWEPKEELELSAGAGPPTAREEQVLSRTLAHLFGYSLEYILK